MRRNKVERLTKKQTEHNAVEDEMPTVKDFIDNERVKKLVAITNRINIFSILGKDESETSDTLFMAWLFDLDKEKSNCFCRMFLKKIRFDFEFDYFKVFPEKTISSLSKMFDIGDSFSKITTRPDIAIIFYRNEDPCGLLLIENKINANESENQTKRYAQFMNSLSSVLYKKGIFMTRKNDEASSEYFEHFERNKVLKETVKNYQKQIDSNGTNPAVIGVIKQYCQKLYIEDEQDEIEMGIINEFRSLILIINDDEKMKRKIPDNYLLTYNYLYKRCKAYSKTVYNNWQEYKNFLTDIKNYKFELVAKIKKINDILVDEYGFIPHYSPANISYSFKKGIKMINTTNQKFAWLVVVANDLKIEFAKDPKMNWHDFENQLKKEKEFAGIRLVKPKESYGRNFGVRISSIKEFDEIVRRLIEFVKGYLLEPR